jgi:hypothetical protein
MKIFEILVIALIGLLPLLLVLAFLFGRWSNAVAM